MSKNLEIFEAKLFRREVGRAFLVHGTIVLIVITFSTVTCDISVSVKLI